MTKVYPIEGKRKIRLVLFYVRETYLGIRFQLRMIWPHHLGIVQLLVEQLSLFPHLDNIIAIRKHFHTKPRGGYKSFTGETLLKIMVPGS